MAHNPVTRTFRDNPPLILVLIALILLLASGVTLVLGNSSLADDFTLVAYFLLVIGVLGQLVWVAYEERRAKPASK
jgi:hypothetical protein